MVREAHRISKVPAVLYGSASCWKGQECRRHVIALPERRSVAWAAGSAPVRADPAQGRAVAPCGTPESSPSLQNEAGFSVSTTWLAARRASGYAGHSVLPFLTAPATHATALVRVCGTYGLRRTKESEGGRLCRPEVGQGQNRTSRASAGDGGLEIPRKFASVAGLRYQFPYGLQGLG
jgi:hypothetical protein